VCVCVCVCVCVRVDMQSDVRQQLLQRAYFQAVCMKSALTRMVRALDFVYAHC